MTVSTAIFLASKLDAYKNVLNEKVVQHYILEASVDFFFCSVVNFNCFRMASYALKIADVYISWL